MYSFQPVLDTSANHGGLCIFLAVMAVILVIIAYEAYTDGWHWLHLVGIAMVVGFSWLVGNISYADKPPTNVPVSANYVEFQSEGYSNRNGKHKSDRHYTYVVYEVDGNYVLLKAGTGHLYPKRAILYRN